MAFHDDTGVLLSYLRHSFVTNDDTGEAVGLLLHVWMSWVLSWGGTYERRRVISHFWACVRTVILFIDLSTLRLSELHLECSHTCSIYCVADSVCLHVTKPLASDVTWISTTLLATHICTETKSKSTCLLCTSLSYRSVMFLTASTSVDQSPSKL